MKTSASPVSVRMEGNFSPTRLLDGKKYGEKQGDQKREEKFISLRDFESLVDYSLRWENHMKFSYKR